MAMLEGYDGAVWVGTMGGGLNRFDPQTMRAESFQHDPAVPTTLAASGVMSLLEVDQAAVGRHLRRRHFALR